MSKKSGNAIADLERELENAKHSYLRSHGWKHTSETPGCLWMWVKRCEYAEGRWNDDGTDPCWIMVSTDTAISMQRHSCAIRGNAW